MARGKQSQGPRADGLDSRVNASGGIKPGSHPAPETPSQFDGLVKVASKVGNAVLGGLDRLNSTGSKKSPSTRQDRGHK